VLKALISILLNDPLDVIILIKEQPPVDDGEGQAVILGIWTVKNRD